MIITVFFNNNYMNQLIDDAFIKNEGKYVLLYSQGIDDADFKYLLGKETNKIENLNLGTY